MRARSTKPSRIRVGISSCLLGAKVRYDGQHKLDTFLRDTLGAQFEFVPVCPEVAIGLGVPRPPIHLIGTTEAPRAVGRDDPALDVTAKLLAYGRTVARELDDISGYIFKSRSPSCGMAHVPVTGERGRAQGGRGLFAQAFMQARPLLPVEEEGRLGDPDLRDDFIERVFVYQRWQALLAEGLSAARLLDFHTRHKLVVMAHDVEAYRRLGRMLATIERRALRAQAERYVTALMQALARRATRARHANVLEHIMGYFKAALDRADKAELRALIRCYRVGELPRAVPLTLLRHHLWRHPNDYLAAQVYLHPAPAEMLLRQG
jgi:uncharacterized protein YbgA (DUF1722 family)/uncharacterized protein YbbK (DUF523 family)